MDTTTGRFGTLSVPGLGAGENFEIEALSEIPQIGWLENGQKQIRLLLVQLRW